MACASRRTRRPSTLWESRGVPNRKILAYDMTTAGAPSSRASGAPRCGTGNTRRHALRRRWQTVVRMGQGSPDLDGVMVFAPDGKPIGRIALPALRQRVIRRAEAQPPVYGGKPIDLRLVRQHAGRTGRLRRSCAARGTLPLVLSSLPRDSARLRIKASLICTNAGPFMRGSEHRLQRHARRALNDDPDRSARSRSIALSTGRANLRPARVLRPETRSATGESSWLSTTFIDPSPASSSCASRVTRCATAAHTILVDSCVGNHKPRPIGPCGTC